MSITQDQIQALVDQGLAKAWTHPGTGEVRHYLQIEALLDLKIERYNTGNIRSASLAGEAISNTAAGYILGTNPWIDPAGNLQIRTNRRTSDIPALVEAAITTRTAAKAPTES
jgi:hypothetical protein